MLIAANFMAWENSRLACCNDFGATTIHSYEDAMLNGQKTTDESVQGTSNLGNLVITHPVHDRDLIEAFQDSSFRSYVSNYVGV